MLARGWGHCHFTYIDPLMMRLVSRNYEHVVCIDYGLCSNSTLCPYSIDLVHDDILFVSFSFLYIGKLLVSYSCSFSIVSRISQFLWPFELFILSLRKVKSGRSPKTGLNNCSLKIIWGFSSIGD